MTWMIYGANGYTGELAAREAARRGLQPVLAGRNPEAVSRLATELGMSHRAFGLDDPAAVRKGIEGMAAVLHCAGPFILTSRPMVDACLASGISYLDITGEINVFESVLSRGDEAKRVGVALLPGVGFDVVPSDCLAARLAAELPGAVALTLAFAATRGSISRGTMATMIESLPHAGAIRRKGRIVPVPPAFDAREIDFPGGRRQAMTIPWGDVSTAWWSTGIPDIRVYTGTPPKTIRRMRRIAPFLPLLGWKPVKRFLQKQVRKRVTGPSEEARRTGRVELWGEVRDAAGRTVTSTLVTPEAYHLTAISAVESAERAALGEVAAGAWTPSKAFGKDYVLGFEGVTAGAFS